jgi:succinate dehydrogenase/fumarate reductase cytochrome b subunit
MSALFRVLGLLLAGYIVVAVLSGAVYAKSAVWGRTFRRAEEPLRYWSAIAAYALLSLALMFWF